jgi:hypothetical protein
VVGNKAKQHLIITTYYYNAESKIQNDIHRSHGRSMASVVLEPYNSFQAPPRRPLKRQPKP